MAEKSTTPPIHTIVNLDFYLGEVEKTQTKPIRPPIAKKIRVGLDLGTSSIVLVVLTEDGVPLGLARREASVVKDGLVVDFSGARAISQKLREELEKRLEVKLPQAALAVPPGTGERDKATHGYVGQAAGLEPTGIFDEPLAANLLLGLKDGALADLGGGTTGVAVFRSGKMVLSFDEPTGGYHMSLVIAGNLKIPLERAEAFKLDPKNRPEVAPMIAPVLSKMGQILAQGLKKQNVPSVFLVGGSAMAPGAAQIIAKETGLEVKAAPRSDLITPVGIALACEPFCPQLL
ncbi:MAG: ethanolamine utilization protein EutJ [Deltaproteobacteria bacterium]|jgi:ethanolamine utilization protein EutJ|nr:ethanolamine utilization protein EutJ [Deltaproteobacteria bacterium]